MLTPVEVIAHLKQRLQEIPEWHDEILRVNPSLDRLQQCQSIDARVLVRALNLIRDTDAARHFSKVQSRVSSYPNHRVIEVSGFDLQGLIAALETATRPAKGKEASNG